LFVLTINDELGSAATSQVFHATITFNGVRIFTNGIPDSVHTVLRAGKTATATLLVGNTGVAEKSFFLDPRLATTGVVPLEAPDSYSVTLSITSSQSVPLFAVPPEVSALTFTGHSPTPVNFDVYPASGAPPFGYTGSPDIYHSTGYGIDPATGQYATSITVWSTEVAPGLWQAVPEQFGPFGGGGAAPSTFDVSASAVGQPFDRQVATSTNDIWSPFARDFRPISLKPDHVGEIAVRFTPSGTPGKVVHGFLYLETFSDNSLSGDELAAIPYTYTIGR